MKGQDNAGTGAVLRCSKLQHYCQTKLTFRFMGASSLDIRRLLVVMG